MRIGDDWLTDPRTQAVMRAIGRDDSDQVLFVGGCVRNSLLREPVSDIDIATSVLPQEVMRRAAKAGLNPVPTGIDHGTVTVLSGGKGDAVAHEVTTFRRDIRTDGRHAQVVFGTDLDKDARRRDFTMNALYATANGQVVDPLGGLADLLARRVRFIGDANQRIAEDRLRVLRFFRFHAQYGGDHPLDADGLAACARARGDLGGLSRERVGAEMAKLLGAAHPGPAIGAMDDTGILSAILGPAFKDPSLLGKLLVAESSVGVAADWIRRLWALVPDSDPTDALRLSRNDTRRLALIRHGLEQRRTPAEAAYRNGLVAGIDLGLAGAALGFWVFSTDDGAKLANAAEQTCPVTAADLMPGLSGPALGQRLAELEDAWIESGFRLTKQQLLSG